MPQNPAPQTQPQEISLDEWEERVRSNYGIPQKLWRGMAEQESGGDVGAVSSTGVRGKWQVTRATAKQYRYNRDDPFEQAAAAGKHLKTLYDKLGHIKGDDARWWGALAQYYGGEGAIDRDGNLSTRSQDQVSNAMEHVNRVAQRIAQTQGGEAPQPGATTIATNGPTRAQSPSSPASSATGLDWLQERGSGTVTYPPSPLPSHYGTDYTRSFDVNYSNEQAQYDARGRRKIGSRDLGLAPAEGMTFDLSGGVAGKAPAPARPTPLSQQPPKPARLSTRGPVVYPSGRQEPEPFAPQTVEQLTTPVRHDVERRNLRIGPEARRRLQKIEEFEKQPWLTQKGQQADTYLAGSGAELSRLANRAIGAVVGGVKSYLNPTVPFKVEDVRSEAFKQWEETRQKELAEEEQRYRPTFANEVAGGIIKGSGPAAAMMLGGEALGAGKLVSMGLGGAYGALSADWNDPKRAAVQTALSAVVPYGGGKLGSAVTAPVVRRLTGPVAQRVAGALGEIGGGSVAMGGQSAAEQQAFEGQVDWRKVAAQGAIGAGLSTPGALSGARPMRTGERSAPEPLPALRSEAVTPERTTRELAPLQPPPRLTPERAPSVEPNVSTPGAQVAGGPVSPRWLNTNRQQAARLLGIDPSQIPRIEESNAPSQPAKPEATEPSLLRALLTDEGGSAKLGLGISEAIKQRGRAFETIGAAQTVAQLGSPGFVLRNIIQHASHGAQELVTQGVAGLIDKAASAVTGKRTVGGFGNPIEAAKEIGRFVEDSVDPNLAQMQP